MTKFAQTFVRDSAVLFSDVGQDVVALSVVRGECFAMQDVTSDIWRLLEHPISFDDLCAELERLYHVSQAQCRDEVSSVLAQMQEKGLIVTTG